MSAGSDNAMTRFLFAILQQKNLKDVSRPKTSGRIILDSKCLTLLKIDWNQVARNPVLSQEITNGHAARMRYSRFRSALLGLEPMRRNRTTTPKSRVTKSKKDPKPKKNDKAKAEPSASPAPPPSKSRETAPSPTPSPPVPVSKVKQEVSHHGLEDYWDSRLTPRLTPGPVQAPMPAPVPNPGMNTPLTIQPRLLTPCSDTDVFSPLAASPASDMLNMPYDFTPPPMHDPAWHQGLAYSPLTSPYPFNDFGAMPCDHQQHPDDFVMVNRSIEDDGDRHLDMKQEWDDSADVKHKGWDHYF